MAGTVTKQTISDLIPFLGDRKIQVKLVAAEQIAILSTDLKLRGLFKECNVVRPLCRLIGSSDVKLSRAVLSALINLSTDKVLSQDMIDNHVISRVVDGILDSSNKIPELYSILLSNISTLPTGSNKLLQIGDPLMGYYVTVLLEKFLLGQELETKEQQDEKEKAAKAKEKDTWAWIAGIFNNVTQTSEGRLFFLDKKRNIFKKLLPFTNHPNVVRRRGVLSSIRNILFESTHHELLLSDDDLLTAIVTPLRGPEQFTNEEVEGMPKALAYVLPNKTREVEVDIRGMLVDCILLLTSTKFGRETLRAKKIYPILREYDKTEEDDAIKTNIFNIINVLVGLDENPNIQVNVNPAQLVTETHHDEEHAQGTSPPVQTPVPQAPRKVIHYDTDEEGEKIEEI